MIESVQDWNGKNVTGSRSKGGVLALADFSDNLMKGDSGVWPPAPIVQKLYRSRQESAFAPDSRRVLTRKLGYYSDLQSLHSEDAITWSYFGTMSLLTEKTRTRHSNWLLSHLGLPWRNTRCEITLWRRIPHPDSLSPGGPEIDVLIDGDKCLIQCEAKWLSSEGMGQGVAGNKGQMQLRREFLHAYAPRIYGSRATVLLGVAPAFGGIAIPVDGDRVRTRLCTWSELAGSPDHPNSEEFARYLSWKRGLSKATGHSEKRK